MDVLASNPSVPKRVSASDAAPTRMERKWGKGLTAVVLIVLFLSVAAIVLASISIARVSASDASFNTLSGNVLTVGAGAPQTFFDHGLVEADRASDPSSTRITFKSPAPAIPQVFASVIQSTLQESSVYVTVTGVSLTGCNIVLNANGTIEQPLSIAWIAVV